MVIAYFSRNAPHHQVNERGGKFQEVSVLYSDAPQSSQYPWDKSEWRVP